MVVSVTMTSCNSGLGFEPTLSPIPTVLTTPTATATLTPTPTASSTPTVTFTPTATEIPYLTLVFYGDSDTAVGEMGDGKKHGGYSYVTDLSPMLPVSYTLVISNHGGRTAKWGYNHLEDDVLNFHPDVVTVWWGLNDLYSCPGIFDRGSNRLIQYQLDLLVAEHTRYLKMQIDVLLAHGTSVSREAAPLFRFSWGSFPGAILMKTIMRFGSRVAGVTTIKVLSRWWKPRESWSPSTKLTVRKCIWSIFGSFIWITRIWTGCIGMMFIPAAMVHN